MLEIVASLDLTNNPKHQAIAFGSLLAAWSSIYTVVNLCCQFKGLSAKKSDDTKNRIVSMVHGVLSFWLAASQYIPKATFNQPNSPLQNWIVMASLTYCVYDLLACLYYRLSDASLVIHHSFSIAGFGFALLEGYGAIDAIGGLFVAQVSNFPMHLRIILRNFSLKNTLGYEWSQNIYLGFYMIFRGMVSPVFVWYPCITSSNSPLAVKLMCTALILQSFYFINEMRQIIAKKLERSKQIKSKGIVFGWFSENQSQLEKLSFYRKAQVQKIF